MNNKQRAKYEKIFTEPIYILDVIVNDTSYVCKISGSTANIYETVIDKRSRSISCSCPDSKINSRSSHTICKHCCFVLFRVIKFNEGDFTGFFNTFRLSDRQMDYIDEKMNHINVRSAEYSNQHYTDLYNAFKNGEIGKEIKVENRFSQHRDLKESDICGICYCEFEHDANLQCPICNNIIHKDCMEKWLGMGKISCPYCRTECWSQYGKEENKGGHKGKKTTLFGETYDRLE